MVTEELEIKETESVVVENVEERLKIAQGRLRQLCEALEKHMQDWDFRINAEKILKPFISFHQNQLLAQLAEHLNEIGRADLVERIAVKLKGGEKGEVLSLWSGQDSGGI